jgi:peptide/nickel transport system ATP-binding protein
MRAPTARATLFANPRHPYTEALFQAPPDQAAETRERLYSISGAPPDLINPPNACRFAPRCRYAEDHCREEEPRLVGETPEHRYSCFQRWSGTRTSSPAGSGSGWGSPGR